MTSPQSDRNLQFASAGVEFGVILLALTGAGYLVDRHLGTLPIGTLSGLAGGFAGALWRLIRQVRPPRKNDNPNRPPSEEDRP